MDKKSKLTFRKATLTDAPILEKLIRLSSDVINGQYYEKHIVQASVGNIWTVDSQLIRDETYWVAQSDSGQIVGCGGWSKRNLLFGNDVTMKTNGTPVELDPTKDPARIRAFFVHPEFTRRGIGRALLSICEREAASKGFKSLELVATLSGVSLYESCGYQKKKLIHIDLGNDLFGDAYEMGKSII